METRGVDTAGEEMVEALQGKRRERLGMADHDEILVAGRAPLVVGAREEARLVAVERDHARRGSRELAREVAALHGERRAVAEGAVARAAQLLRRREAPEEGGREPAARD